MRATDTTLYAKVVGRKTGSSVARLNEKGRVEASAPLPEPHWRYAGFLRA